MKGRCTFLCQVLLTSVAFSAAAPHSFEGRPHRNLLQAAAPEAAPAVPIPSAVAAAANVTVATLVAPNVTVSGLVSTALLDDAAYVSVPQTTDANNINISVTTASGSTLANISAAQTPLIVNTTSPVLAQTTSSVTLPSSPSRVLVQFNNLADTANSTAIPADVQSLDAVVNSTYLPNVDTHVINVDNSTADAATLVTELRARDDVAYASLDYQVNVQYADTPYGYSLYNLDLVQAPCDWETQTIGSSNTAVCIIDSGIQTDHPDLKGNVWVNTAEIAGNGIDDDGNGCVDDVLGGCGFINGVQVPVTDDNSHGTHVAGTIGATKNGAGVLGVAQKVSLMACKFLDADGNGYNSDAIACINYCAANFKRMGQKVPIYSNSWGCLNCYDPTVYNAIANTNGLFMFAAGNNGQYTDGTDITQQFFPADYGLPNQISVGASDTNDAMASFSNYGARTVSLFAPGVNILSTIPNSTYAYKSGTSMATPHTAAAAALMATQYPSLTMTNLKASMLGSVTPVSALNGLCQTNGRLNVYNQSLLLAKSPYKTTAATGLTKDTTVKSSCSATAAAGIPEVLDSESSEPESEGTPAY